MYTAHHAREAKDLAKQALVLDPEFARAHAILAGQTFTCAWFECSPAEVYTEDALKAAQKAIELDPEDSF